MGDRARLPLAKKDLRMKYKYLHFGAVDEEAWLYLNGKLFFEHTVESTGFMPEELWITPFIVPLKRARKRRRPLATPSQRVPTTSLVVTPVCPNCDGVTDRGETSHPPTARARVRRRRAPCK